MNVTFMRRGQAGEEVCELHVSAHTQLYGASTNPHRPCKCNKRNVLMHVTQAYICMQAHKYI